MHTALSDMVVGGTPIPTGTLPLVQAVPLGPYEVLVQKYAGIELTQGRYTGVRNEMYLVKDSRTQQEHVKMTCNADNTMFTLLSPIDAEIIRNGWVNRGTWVHHKGTGYVYSTRMDKKKGTLHSIVMQNKDNAIGSVSASPLVDSKTNGGSPSDDHSDAMIDTKLSIDHVNRNKLDNRRENLCWATQTVQNQNTGKRSRQFNARDLPVGITQEMLPKYVVYYRECYHKDKDLWREFFKVESHPKLAKPMCGSKSGKFTPVEKLAEIKQKLVDLENDVVHEKPLPPYHTIQNFRASPNLVYDHRASDGQRYNLRMKMRAGAEVADEVARLRTKFEKKYPGVVM
jgi:hypothetical protein